MLFTEVINFVMILFGSDPNIPQLENQKIAIIFLEDWNLFVRSKNLHFEASGKMTREESV